MRRLVLAAALAGMVGLIWIFWNKFDYDPNQFGKALTIAVKTAGQDINTSLDTAGDAVKEAGEDVQNKVE